LSGSPGCSRHAGIYTLPADGSGTPMQVASGYLVNAPVWQSLPRAG
jgi:hypothetical protein